MKVKEEAVIRVNIKALKLVQKWRKWFIPSIILNALFGSLSPYVNLYMSAEIVNELAVARNTRRLTALVLFTIIADLIIVVIGRLFAKLKDYEWQSFEDCEKRMFIEYGFTLDYTHMENPEIQQKRRKIDESRRINNLGIWAMLYSLQNLSTDMVQIILSVCFATGLFTLIMKQSDNMIGAVFFPLVILSLIVLSVLCSLKNAKKLAKLSEDISNNMLDVNRLVEGTNMMFHIGKDARLYHLIGIYKEHRKRLLNTHINGNKKYWFGYRNTQIPDQFISQGIHFTIYTFICLNAVRGFFEIGSVIKYVGFISKLVSALKSLSADIAMVKMNAPFLLHYLNFFEIENRMYYGTLPVEKRADNEYEIEFCNVSFKYPGTENYALRNLSLKLNIGQRLAVVGMNGSGKTTMIKLLCRLYDPDDGEITLNGINIKKYRYNEYMGIFSVVFQDYKLFSFSLGQNVAASVNVDADKAIESLHKVGFAERLSFMRKGLDTSLYKDFDEDGVEISGGEAQKIALARALYKNAPFIVLDEPTAALDPIAEFEIYLKFNEIVGEKTAIYISHRLSSCRFCDDIAVFHEAELIQRGNHDTLVADKNGKYYELWSAQAQYYAENSI